MSNIFKDMLKLIHAGLDNGYKTQISVVDWKKLLYLSKIHSVTNIAYYGIEKLNMQIDDDIKKEFEKERNLSILKDVKQEFELNSIIKQFEKSGIDCVLLKGTVIKKLYPTSDMRTMGDIDFLVKEKDMKPAIEILYKMGYTNVHNDEDHKHEAHEELIKPPFMMVEIHRDLVSKGRFEKIDAYYDDLWDKLEKVDGFSHVYQMNKEEFYIFMLVHIMKHYKFAGTGVRNFIDVWVYLKKYNDVLDWDYINNSFKQMEILEFSKNVKCMISSWFDGLEYNDKTKRMTEFVFTSGVYGNKKNEETIRIVNKSNNISGEMKKQILRKIFPDIALMKKMYPVLKKHIYLLPFLYVVRLLDRMLFKRDRVNIAIKNNTDKDYIFDTKKHFDEIGL